ncbi:MAG: exopolysaccharide Pel transporter PelG [Lachnospiraceae bacterium]|nr:exopolysaccharide Pel transporter PelG [Lachnospiraceae bacterium]
MAGIGFELKKMFDKKGLFAAMKAYGYASVVCVGPMMLGMALLFGIRLIAETGGATETETEILNSMVTHALLCSLVFTNAFSMVTTRYVSDQLYMNEKKKVMPSFWGSISLMLVLGVIGYGIFLFRSEMSFTYKILNLILFGELIVVWTEMNYLTAIKDYSGIMKTFVFAMVLAWLGTFLLMLTGMEIITAMILSVCIAYGAMMVWYYVLLLRYFPSTHSSSMEFLKWFDKYPSLILLGASSAIGVYGHIIIMWSSDIGKSVLGSFRGAPSYDVPALLAFMSILVTTINFVTSVEVKFYPKYRTCFSILNDGGSYMDIEQAQRELKTALYKELTYTFTKQVFVTIVFIVAGTLFLPDLPLGMTDDMLGVYRVLCIGYAFYAVGNCTTLMQLYFSDNKGGLIGTLCFMIISILGTLYYNDMGSKYYGVGFLVAGIIYAIVSLMLLRKYLKNLLFYVLCSQPLVVVERVGVFSRISNKLKAGYEKKHHDEIVMEGIVDEAD